MLVKVLNRCTRDGCIYVELLCVEVSCCSLLLCNYNQVDSVTQHITKHYTLHKMSNCVKLTGPNRSRVKDKGELLFHVNRNTESN